MVSVLLAVALAIATHASAALAPAREDLTTAALRATARVHIDAGVALAAAVERPAPQRRVRAGVLWQGDLDHFERFVSTLTLDNGRKMRLEPFQRVILRDFFDGCRESLILIPKKNGKTTLLAALVVYHLCFVDEARGFVAATSKEQASYLYEFARGFVNRSPALQRRILVRGGTRELRARRDGGFARIIAADSETADGAGPTLAIVDELHRAKSLALYDVFRDGLDARDGSMLTISTAGSEEESPLGVMRAKFLASPGKRTKGRYTYVRSRDGSDCMHEWALRPGDDVEDLDLVKSVNPLSSMTKAKLARRRASKSMTLPTWRRFACNLWTQSHDAAIADVDWSAKARAGAQLPDGEETDAVIGIDLGWTQDSTALVPVGYPEPATVNADGELELPAEAVIDARLVIIPAGARLEPRAPWRLEDPALDADAVTAEAVAFLEALRGGLEQASVRIEEGRYTDERIVKACLRALHALWPRCYFALDPNAGGQAIAQWIERELCDGDEDRVLVYSQQPAAMAATSIHFAAAIATTTVQEPVEAEDPDEDEPRTVPIYHPDDRDLNRHVLGAVARSVGGERWRLDKRRTPGSGATRVRPRPVDGAIAAALGYRALMAPREAGGLEPFVIVASR